MASNSSYRHPGAPWTPLTHPFCHLVTKEVNNYFLQHWPFPDDKSRQTFIAADLQRAACWIFPKSLSDRIHLACRLLTLAALVGDHLGRISLEDGAAITDRLMPISRGTGLPNRAVPIDYITHDIWQDMRAKDKALADEVLEPLFTCWRAQSDPTRLKPMGLKRYLEYREKDVGSGFLSALFLSALMRFSMGLTLTAEDFAITHALNVNFSNHLTVMNDIWSFDKGLLAAEDAHKEGGALCSAVTILADQIGVPASAAKRVLYHICRELELKHETLANQILETRNSLEMRFYIKGLEYQMSGNEEYLRTSLRYLVSTAQSPL
ncbi:Aristolochene synthase in complex with 12,13-Difluorofarnesyl diphosphate [Hypomontagnella monticulosa]|nr:Aristolochene synthase in complex with 12,13-Difluorofarnesyl diphosphate [Hypomontagnella monticulosa]